jgi:hypothetical protein
MAPFENVVVECASPLGTCGIGAATLAAAMVVSFALATGVLVPAAESTQLFMSVRLILATLSARAFAATVVGVESTTTLRGGATKVVN